MEREQLENAINGLASHLQSGVFLEDRYQEFFETNRIIFHVLGYDEIYPKLRLPLPDGEFLEPDFLVKKPDGLFEVIDLKTPKEKLVKRKKHRDTFYARIHQYVSQVVNYSEYFDDSANREQVRALYSLDVQKRPDGVIIGGMESSIDKKEVHTQTRRYRPVFRILTYNDLLSALQFHHASLYGHSESLIGISIYMRITPRKADVKRRKYILDAGQSLQKNRFSIYLDERDRLCCELLDAEGNSYLVFVQPGTHEYRLGRQCHICCEFGNSDSFALLLIRVNNQIADKREIFSPINIARDIDWSKHIVGADLGRQNHATFDLAAYTIYEQMPDFRTRADLVNAMWEL